MPKLNNYLGVSFQFLFSPSLSILSFCKNHIHWSTGAIEWPPCSKYNWLQTPRIYKKGGFIFLNWRDSLPLLYELPPPLNLTMFQFKLSNIPRIFQGWTFDFFTSNPYQKLYYFSTGAIIWPPCRKDNFVRTKKIPILGLKDGLKWRLLQTKECKIVNQTFSTTLSSFYKEAWGSW